MKIIKMIETFCWLFTAICTTVTTSFGGTVPSWLYLAAVWMIVIKCAESLDKALNK